MAFLSISPVYSSTSDGKTSRPQSHTLVESLKQASAWLIVVLMLSDLKPVWLTVRSYLFQTYFTHWNFLKSTKQILIYWVFCVLGSQIHRAKTFSVARNATHQTRTKPNHSHGWHQTHGHSALRYHQVLQRGHGGLPGRPHHLPLGHG